MNYASIKYWVLVDIDRYQVLTVLNITEPGTMNMMWMPHAKTINDILV